MRHVYVAPRRISNAGVYEIKEGAGIRQPAPDRVRNLLSYETQLQYEVRRQQLDKRDKACQRSAVKKERRKINRRIIRKLILLELRSGIERRRRNQRESDIVEHIDEKV